MELAQPLGIGGVDVSSGEDGPCFPLSAENQRHPGNALPEMSWHCLYPPPRLHHLRAAASRKCRRECGSAVRRSGWGAVAGQVDVSGQEQRPRAPLGRPWREGLCPQVQAPNAA